MADLRPSIESALGAFGTEATITLPDETVLEGVDVFWLPPATDDVPAASGGRRVDAQFRRSEQIHTLVVPKGSVPSLPRGSIVNVEPYDGGDARDFKVDAIDVEDFDCRHAVMIPYEAEA